MSLADDYWKTLEGILARLADLAHHFTWSLVNATYREAIMVLEDEEPLPEGAKRILSWVTMGDDIVCELCQDNEGDYGADDILPDMPAHVMCRCHWEVS